jgi:ribosomal protein S17E
LNFSDPEKSFLGKMFSSKSKKFPDNFSGFITKKDELIEKKGHYYPKEKNNVFATFEGEWTYNINIDGVDYWKQGEAKFYPSERMEYTLPSDSSYRPDIHLLRAGYDDYAQIAKTELEELQRYEKKLRDDYRKSKK